MNEMKVVYRLIEEIKPYDRNPRKNDIAVANVAESIRQYGWQQPIVVDADGVIIVGHTRYKAAKKLRLKKIPVVVADNLTPEQVREYRLIDNKTNEAAEWDMDLLPGELEGLTFDGFEGLDWGVELQNEAIKQAVKNGDYDAAAENIAEPRSRTGDIYQLGKHRLMCGDSTRQADVQKLAGGGTGRPAFNRPSVWGQLHRQNVRCADNSERQPQRGCAGGISHKSVYRRAVSHETGCSFLHMAG